MARTILRWFRNLLACLGGLYLTVTVTPVDRWWASALAGPWEDPKGDTLIVLAGSGLEDGTIGLNSYWRSVYAARAFPQGFRRVVLSGGSSGGSTAMAYAMRDFLVAQGIAPTAIVLETNARSTHENAVEVARLLAGQPDRKILLTSDLHMFRAYRAFRKAGIDVSPRPLPDALKRYNCVLCRWDVFLDLNVESVKILYYYYRGWI